MSGLFETFKRCMTTDYFNFKGRARRREFWFFQLGLAIAYFACAIVLGMGLAIYWQVAYDPYTSSGDMADVMEGYVRIFSLVTFIPSLSVAARRFHDVGHSGWWLLTCIIFVGFILAIVWGVMDGNRGANDYGPDPKGEGSATQAATLKSAARTRRPSPKLTFSELQVISLNLTSNFFNFCGRARRREYWLSVLVVGVIDLILALVAILLVAEGAVGEAAVWVVAIAMTVLCIPILAVTVRRLHDINRSGWWVLINAVPFVGEIILFVWTLTPGTDGSNDYGLDPRDTYDELIGAGKYILEHPFGLEDDDNSVAAPAPTDDYDEPVAHHDASASSSSDYNPALGFINLDDDEEDDDKA